MNAVDRLKESLARFPRAAVAHLPTPLEPLANLGGDLDLSLFVKRDDCTGIGFGGNKVRQLEFYLGAALAEEADTVLITGAVQSNYVRTAAAMAGRFGMDCHIQLEERVTDVDDLYRNNGNVLLDRLLGATLHSFPEGENEAGADAAVGAIAERLRGEGRSPYIIPLGAGHPPLGALGYASAAIELSMQVETIEPFDEIVIASGSAATHVGLLVGLRALGLDIPVSGICVRRAADIQAARVKQRADDLCKLMGLSLSLADSDFRLFDGSLAPGYGRLNDATVGAIRLTAQREGLFLDPVYTGKVMAALIQLNETGGLAGRRILFWHTGGQPALFGYAGQLTEGSSSGGPS
ncbi:D-cysteine desulfhydrase family protein [Pelagibius litoralis]|uniref:D-cysteine desulfhydrase family protein n=1 Tax=Pelagibius litoralis TaxID=374515 RepID=A0A967EVM5_9PROT|nr:D-cysteine desulfhydrase family protein [Pelagibius litoralis]NIA68044.1 D-cysteine desulfhydrase family protein [Pelagibius litoralis]